MPPKQIVESNSESNYGIAKIKYFEDDEKFIF